MQVKTTEAEILFVEALIHYDNKETSKSLVQETYTKLLEANTIAQNSEYKEGKAISVFIEQIERVLPHKCMGKAHQELFQLSDEDVSSQNELHREMAKSNRKASRSVVTSSMEDLSDSGSGADSDRK